MQQRPRKVVTAPYPEIINSDEFKSRYTPVYDVEPEEKKQEQSQQSAREQIVNSPEFKKKWKAVEKKENPAIKRSHYIYGVRSDDPGMLTDLGKLRHQLQYLKTDFDKGYISYEGGAIVVRKPTYWNDNIDLDRINSRLQRLSSDVARRVVEDARRYMTVRQEVESGYRYDRRENR